MLRAQRGRLLQFLVLRVPQVLLALQAPRAQLLRLPDPRARLEQQVPLLQDPRGLQALQVLRALEAREPGAVTCLMGNHEAMLLDAVAGRSPDLWRINGGGAGASLTVPQGSGFISYTDAAGHFYIETTIATNLFMLGFAWQRGLVPVSAEAIAKAIELNAVAVDANKRAFAWGRLAAVDPDAAERAAKPSVPPAEPLSDSLDAVIARRSADLVAYQNEAYAARYRALVARVAEAEKTRGMGFTGLALGSILQRDGFTRARADAARNHPPPRQCKNLLAQRPRLAAVQHHAASKNFASRDTFAKCANALRIRNPDLRRGFDLEGDQRAVLFQNHIHLASVAIAPVIDPPA